MDDARVGQMPVVTGGALVGMIDREQILHYVRVRSELGV
jgi:predicted transcriptional regulator